MHVSVTQNPYDDAPRCALLFFAALSAAMFICVILPRALVFAPALAAFLTFIFMYVKGRRLPALDLRLAGFLGGILLLAFLSSFWSMDRAYAFERALKIAPLFLSGTLLLAMVKLPVLAVKYQRAVAITSVVFCALSALTIFLEYRLAFPLSRMALGLGAQTEDASIKGGFILNRSLVYLVLLCMPSLLALALSNLRVYTKAALVTILFLSLGAAFLYTKSQTAQLTAVVIGLMCLYPSHWKKARYLMAGCIIAMMLVLPFVMRPTYEAVSQTETTGIVRTIVFEASILHRFEVWNFISSKIQEKPLLGYGIEATRFLKSDKIMPYMGTDHVMHPHNVVLQVWIEFGLAGIILACAFVFFLLRRLDSFPPLLQRYYTAMFAAILCVLSISYGLWQAWQIGMIFAIVAFSRAIAHIHGISHKIPPD